MRQVKSLRGTKVATAEVEEGPFGARLNPVVLREAVLMYQANRRVGTASTKTRSEVKGSTKKIYKQKHTGRARHGDRKANIFRGGGIAHGPRPRDYSYAMPKKALRRALRVAVAGKFRDEEVFRWEGSPVDAPSTRTLHRGLESLGIADSALLVAAGSADAALVLSARNLPRIRVLPAAEVTAHDVVSHRALVLLDGALEALTGRLGVATSASDGVDTEGSEG